MSKYKPNFLEIEKLIEMGYLTKQVSPCGKLFLLNYTDKTSYERYWNDHTLNNRGTVYEIYTGRVVSRSYPKFFNFSELKPEDQERLLKSKSFKVLEKLDGSMIQAFYYGDKWNFATRGSFISDQAKKAEKIAIVKYSQQLEFINKDYTHLFEVIYPENRVVVNYGDKVDIVLTGIFHTESGDEVNIDLVDSFKKCKTFSFENIQEVISKLESLPFNEEGYVVLFDNGERVKFKGKEYLEMHRIVTKLSPLVIWENMTNGKVGSNFIESIPEEFIEQYKPIIKHLEKQYELILDEAEFTTKILSNLCNNQAKEIGLYLAKNDVEYSKLVFPIFNKKMDQVNKIIMSLIRPTGNNLKD